MRLSRIVTGAVALALLAGCGGTTGATGDDTGGQAGQQEQQASGQDQGQQQEQQPGRKVLGFIPFGPANPTAPSPQMSMYGTLYDDCTAEPDVRFGDAAEAAFWRTALLACRSLRGSDPAGDWQAAQQAWQRDGGSGFDAEGCRATQVQSWLVAYFDTVRSASDLAGVTLGGHADGLACPPVDASVTPDRGAAGTSVTLHWSDSPNLYYTGFSDGPQILLGEVPVEGADDGESVTITVPEGSVGSEVPVAIRYAGQPDIPLGTFTYEAS